MRSMHAVENNQFYKLFNYASHFLEPCEMPCARDPNASSNLNPAN